MGGPCPPGGSVRTRLLLGYGAAALWAGMVWTQASMGAQGGATTAAPARPAAPATAAPARPAGVARPAAAAPAAASEVASRRALLDQYCVTCHNARLKTANLLLDQLDLSQPRRPRGGGREGRPQAARGPDAADRHARGPIRPRSTSLIALDGGRARSQRAPTHLPRARPAPAEPHRVRQRDSRSAGARSGRHEVPAARRLDARLRQHRRRADDVAGADGGVSVGGRQDQPAGDRQRRPRRRRRCSTCRPTRRRTTTSRGCRSAPAAAC